GMFGAALLAGRSALQGGAGRVFVCPLDANAASLDNNRPELMFRTPNTLDFSRMTVVAGCGGGSAIASHLPMLLHSAARLVLDADALNHLARDAELAAALARRSAGRSVMTPHPLEAARLLGSSVSEVQKNRLQAAQLLADRHQCSVVLKGSGSIIAAPHKTPFINPTGNAKLASAGTGDVLAGLVGAYLAQGYGAFEAARTAVFRHGLAADQWQGFVLNASELCLCI
ncbi:MAG: NAD(P)H-hydrate dehydratase, partial [Rhodoferax sp.]|nr:NAD(P)H-hydrate dehydratase [Rhodoferax sp.]